MPESDQFLAQQQRPNGDLPPGALVQALADLRQDMRVGMHELGKRLGKIEETLSMANAEQAVSKVKVAENTTLLNYLEERVVALETAESKRKTREEERALAAQPKQYGPAQTALITVIITVLITPLLAWLLLSFARFAAANPASVSVEAKP